MTIFSHSVLAPSQRLLSALYLDSFMPKFGVETGLFLSDFTFLFTFGSQIFKIRKLLAEIPLIVFENRLLSFDFIFRMVLCRIAQERLIAFSDCQTPSNFNKLIMTKSSLKI